MTEGPGDRVTLRFGAGPAVLNLACDTICGRVGFARRHELTAGPYALLYLDPHAGWRVLDEGEVGRSMSVEADGALMVEAPRRVAGLDRARMVLVWTGQVTTERVIENFLEHGLRR